MFRRRAPLQTSRFVPKTPWRSAKEKKQNKKNAAVPSERCWNKEALLLFETLFGWGFWVREHLHQRQEPRDGCRAAAEIDVLHRRGMILTGSDGSD